MSAFVLFEAAVVAAALSLDAFVATFAYGCNKIHIPRISGMLINLICTLTMGVSFLVGALLVRYIPIGFAVWLSFIILLSIGLVKLMDSITKSIIRKYTGINKQLKLSLFNFKFILHLYAEPQDADVDESKCLSVKEAAVLAVSLSLDGFAVGFSAALLGINGLLVVVFALSANGMAIILGDWLGNVAAERLGFDVSWLAGVLLIVLAASQLV